MHAHNPCQIVVSIFFLIMFSSQLPIHDLDRYPEIQSPFMMFHSVNLIRLSFSCSLEIGINYSIRVLVVLMYVLFEYLALCGL